MNPKLLGRLRRGPFIELSQLRIALAFRLLGWGVRTTWRQRAWLVCAALFSLAGCGSGKQYRTPEPPLSPTLTLSPAEARPGARLDLRVMVGSVNDSYDVFARLDRRIGQQWVPLLTLSAAYPGSPPTARPYSPGAPLRGVGATGSGVQVLRVPDVPAGRYRIAKKIGNKTLTVNLRVL